VEWNGIPVREKILAMEKILAIFNLKNPRKILKRMN
jgi:hypothetical protein